MGRKITRETPIQGLITAEKLHILAKTGLKIKRKKFRWKKAKSKKKAFQRKSNCLRMRLETKRAIYGEGKR
jgi:hypothetical protein